MTIEKVKELYGGLDGMVLCCECPVSVDGEPCDQSATGLHDCWEKILEYLGEDVVNHPPHYTQGDIECIDAMKSAFGACELAVYCKIAAFKYIWRCEHKNGIEDIKKAVWYLNKLIELMEGDA